MLFEYRLFLLLCNKPDLSILALTLDKAREYLKVQVMMGGDYNRNSAKPILAEIQIDHAQAGVDQLIK